MRGTPLTYLVRRILIHRNQCKLQTEIRPLKDIRTATVLIDSSESEYLSVIRDVESFFKLHNIDANIIAPQMKDIVWPGILRRKVRYPGNRSKLDGLFINLNATHNFLSEYEARCSLALFKVGREQLDSEVYDLIVSDNPNSGSPSQGEVFSVIKDLLTKIR